VRSGQLWLPQLRTIFLLLVDKVAVSSLRSAFGRPDATAVLHVPINVTDRQLVHCCILAQQGPTGLDPDPNIDNLRAIYMVNWSAYSCKN
jgi:hypothetical protein